MPTGNLKLSIDIDGDRELSRKLHGYLGRLDDWTGFFQDVVKDWSETMARKFAAEGAIEGDGKWADLSARYAAWKQRKFPGAKLLTRTGRLRSAAVNPETSIKPTQLRMTIDVPYAVYHQSSRPRKVLPRRPFASLTSKQKSRWIAALRKRIWDEGANG